MNRGTRLAIVTGIIIAIAGAATYLAVSSSNNPSMPPGENNSNSTDGGPRQITVDLNESLNVDAK